MNGKKVETVIDRMDKYYTYGMNIFKDECLVVPWMSLHTYPCGIKTKQNKLDT